MHWLLWLFDANLGESPWLFHLGKEYSRLGSQQLAQMVNTADLRGDSTNLARCTYTVDVGYSNTLSSSAIQGWISPVPLRILV